MLASKETKSSNQDLFTLVKPTAVFLGLRHSKGLSAAYFETCRDDIILENLLSIRKRPRELESQV